MAERVCEELEWIELDKQKYITYKKGKQYYYKKENGKEYKVPPDHQIHTGFKMDKYLKSLLDSMCHNMHKDMDFVIIITGSGDVRVGKSTLGLQISYYVAQRIGAKFGLDNICYTAEELMKTSYKHKKTPFMYDEAREGLNTGMAQANIQKKLLQYFAEVGQLNNFYILILPDYFELKKALAINRADILLDVYFGKKKVKDKFGTEVTEKTRGNYRIFKKKDKRMLYLKGKDHLNYFAWKPSIKFCAFNNVYPINEWSYRKKKIDALHETKRTDQKRTHKEIAKKNLTKLLHVLQEKGENMSEVSRKMGHDHRWAANFLGNADSSFISSPKEGSSPFIGDKNDKKDGGIVSK